MCITVTETAYVNLINDFLLFHLRLVVIQLKMLPHLPISTHIQSIELLATAAAAVLLAVVVVANSILLPAAAIQYYYCWQ